MDFCKASPYLRQLCNYLENVGVRHRLDVLFPQGRLRGNFIGQTRSLSWRRFQDFVETFRMCHFPIHLDSLVSVEENIAVFL